MASIRARITASYTVALLGTMAAFTAVLVAERGWETESATVFDDGGP